MIIMSEWYNDARGRSLMTKYSPESTVSYCSSNLYFHGLKVGVVDVEQENGGVVLIHPNTAG